MSKLTHKLNENFVGATIGRPHFEGMTKKEKGITLIALIITIIVMLILTGVTLSITLGDNGLVNKAKEASEATQIAMDRELLLSAVVGAIGIDGKVNFSEIVLPEGFTGSNGTYTSKNGHTFTVNENGEISYTGSDDVIGNGGNETVGFTWESVNLNIDTNTEYVAETDEITVYFLEDGNLTILLGDTILASVYATDSDNIDQTTGNLSFNIDLGEMVNIIITMANANDINLSFEGLESFICIKEEYDNETVYSNQEVLKMLGISNSTGTYRGTWTKIGEDENGNIKLVSTRSVMEYTLGHMDPKAIEAVPIEGNEPTDEENLERSIWSYKNAVNSLNTAAQEATGIINARSIKIEDIYDIIGEGNINKGAEYGKVYNYYYNTETSTVYSKYKTGDSTWSEPYNTNYSSQTFVNDNGETVVVDSDGDEVTLTCSYYNYQLTDEQKAKTGVLATRYYYFATPCVLCSQDGASFRVRYMDDGKINYYTNLFSSSTQGVGSGTTGVRAVVVVPGL